MHWSTPFLGSVPARTTAARNLTAWARRAGSSRTVTGVSSGFQVATASGGRRLFRDVGALASQFAGHGVDRRRMLAGPAFEPIIEGPATQPPERPRLSAARAVPLTDQSTVIECVTPLPANAARPYRVPALLAWLALADGVGLLGNLRLELDLGNGTGLGLRVKDGTVTGCWAQGPTGPGRMITPDGSAPAALVQLLS
jgi:hypothetical protein